MLPFMCLASFSIILKARGEGLLLLLSHLFTVLKVTPILAANCSCVRPNLERNSFIFFANLVSRVFDMAFFPAFIVLTTYGKVHRT